MIRHWRHTSRRYVGGHRLRYHLRNHLRNHVHNHLYRGFTVLEAMIATVLIALLSTFFYAPNVVSKIHDFRRMQADVVAEEMNRIGLAAQDWALKNDNAWPNPEADCALMFSTLTNAGMLGEFDGTQNPKTAFYITGNRALPTANPLVQNVEPGRYYAWCDDEELQIDLFFDDDDARWAHYIANRLAGASVTELEDSDDLRLRSFWPLPSAIPILSDFVSRSAPEHTGAMQGNINMGGNAIIGANDVVLRSGHSLGKTIVYAGVVVPGTRLLKPGCSPGLTPQILASFNSLFHSTGRPLHYAEVFSEDVTVENKPAWRVRTRVIANPGGSGQLDYEDLKVNVLIRCS